MQAENTLLQRRNDHGRSRKGRIRRPNNRAFRDGNADQEPSLSRTARERRLLLPQRGSRPAKENYTSSHFAADSGAHQVLIEEDPRSAGPVLALLHRTIADASIRPTGGCGSCRSPTRAACCWSKASRPGCAGSRT